MVTVCKVMIYLFPKIKRDTISLLHYQDLKTTSTYIFNIGFLAFFSAFFDQT